MHRAWVEEQELSPLTLCLLRTKPQRLSSAESCCSWEEGALGLSRQELSTGEPVSWAAVWSGVSIVPSW